jgi:hypothetical protein
MDVVTAEDVSTLVFFSQIYHELSFLGVEFIMHPKRNKIAATLFPFCFLSLYNCNSKPPSGDGGGVELR